MQVHPYWEREEGMEEDLAPARLRVGLFSDSAPFLHNSLWVCIHTPVSQEAQLQEGHPLAEGGTEMREQHGCT